MPFFIDPATAVSVAWLSHQDDIRRAEQSRLARQFREAQRASKTNTRSGGKGLRAILGHRQATH